MTRWKRSITSLGLLLASCADTAYIDLFGPGEPVLRYTFAGNGSLIRDSAGGAGARALGGAELNGQGSLQLDGEDDFVELPSRLLSRLDSVTVVAWIEWSGASCWQRVFDFGSGEGALGWPGNAPITLFMTPAACSDDSYFAKGQVGPRSFTLRAPRGLPPGRSLQVALTIDGGEQRAALFLDGVQVAEADVPFALGELDDVQNLLGRSQAADDPFARIRYDELRIYGRALRADELSTLLRRGPDAL